MLAQAFDSRAPFSQLRMLAAWRADIYEGGSYTGRKRGDIDCYMLRENTEGEYSIIGGIMYEGTERELAMQESIFSRKGVDWIRFCKTGRQP